MSAPEKYYVGIEIGGTKLQVVLGNADAEILAKHRMDVERSEGASGIRKKIKGPLQELVREYHPEALGIGFGGPVDHEKGRIAVSHHVEGWTDFDLVSWASEITGIPSFIENDANVAALGEACQGNGVGFDRVFYVTLGSGVGGGMVINGEIYHGAVPGESEIGLMAYNSEGKNVESMCSGWAMDARIRHYIDENAGSIIAGLVKKGGGPEARFLAEAIRLGDAGAEKLFEESAVILGWGLSHVVHLFHPQIIILGGGLSLMGNLLVEKVSIPLRKFITRVFQPGPVVKTAALKEEVVGVGALLLARKMMKEQFDQDLNRNKL
jgi:glucokinase